jgi:putative transposase
LWAGRLVEQEHGGEEAAQSRASRPQALMTADRLLAEGKDTAAVCRELGVSEATYHRWRNQFGRRMALRRRLAMVVTH